MYILQFLGYCCLTAWLWMSRFWIRNFDMWNMFIMMCILCAVDYRRRRSLCNSMHSDTMFTSGHKGGGPSRFKWGATSAGIHWTNRCQLILFLIDNPESVIWHDRREIDMLCWKNKNLLRNVNFDQLYKGFIKWIFFFDQWERLYLWFLISAIPQYLSSAINHCRKAMASFNSQERDERRKTT